MTNQATPLNGDTELDLTPVIGVTDTSSTIFFQSSGEETLVNDEAEGRQSDPHIIQMPDNRVLFIIDNSNFDSDGEPPIIARIGEVNDDGSITFQDSFVVDESVDGFDPNSFLIDVVSLSDNRFVIFQQTQNPDFTVAVSTRVGNIDVEGNVSFEESIPVENFEFSGFSDTLITLPDEKILITDVVFDGFSPTRIDAKIGSLDENGAFVVGEEVVLKQTSTEGTVVENIDFVPEPVTLPDGRILFMWGNSFFDTEDPDFSDSNTEAVIADIAPDGSLTLGSPFLVDLGSNADSGSTVDQIIVLPDGRIVVTGREFIDDGDDFFEVISANIGVFNDSGTLDFGELFHPFGITESFQFAPKIVALDEDHILFARNNLSPEDDFQGLGQDDIFAVIAEIDGTQFVASDEVFTINEQTTEVQNLQEVIALPDGRILFSWETSTEDPEFSFELDVAARVFEFEGIDGFRGNENIPLDITLTPGADAEEPFPFSTALIIEISGVPDKALLSNGFKDEANDIWIVTREDLNDLHMTLNENGEQDITLSFTGKQIVFENVGDEGNIVIQVSVFVSDAIQQTYRVVDEVINTDPVTEPDLFTALGSELLNANLLENDSDPDGDDFSVFAQDFIQIELVIDGDPVIGEIIDIDSDPVITETVLQFVTTSALGVNVTIQPNGDFTYTPPEGVVGPDSFEYPLIDGLGGLTFGTAHIDIAPVGAVIGDENDNKIVGNDNQNFLYGMQGNDRLLGGAANDELFGQFGDDVLRGNDGADLLNGGLGNDILVGENGEDDLFGGDGNDRLHGQNDNDRLFGEAGEDILFGGDGNDVLDGGDGDDLLGGQEGDDTLSGGLGDDSLSGHAGNDTINGGDGNDQFYGGAGQDILNGDNGNDVLRGQDGNDTINGDSGDDVLVGGAGLDELQGGDGNDRLHGQDDADQLFGNLGNDILFGGDGNDTLFGGAGNDILAGQNGNDNVFGNDGDDLVAGHDGDDVLDGGDGNDRLVGGAGEDELLGGVGDDILVGNEGDDVLFGGNGDDILVGREDNDQLFGGAGDDRLAGKEGDDLIVGGAGTNRLTGDEGNDTFKFEGETAFTGGIDQVLDFETGDKLDISDILSDFGFDAVNDALEDWVNIANQGDDSLLQIDRDGQESAESFSNIARLHDVSVSLEGLLQGSVIITGSETV